ncbi:glycosyltransferase [Aquibium oceanicum]|uniref:Glycosyltransferase n=1 Tax=Aquibium oceanicum TaxID=1670800 RepID=A0A1L3SQZ2_9HYPH|nr:glycosyltransferase [Aquibium oceanicum]APH71819.1 hypothetical protein BSQ44_10885 [Aquibium oceanicum]
MIRYSKQDIELVRESELFDQNWYLKKYPEVKSLNMDPVEHYLRLGARLGRNPCSDFDTAAYLTNNPDVAERRINPLIHYLVWGRREGRRISVASDLGGGWGQSRNRNWTAVLERIERVGRPAAIVVPIYNAPEETEDCIESVLKHTPVSVRFILIDDASPDPKVREVLARYADISNVTVARNEANLGFTRTVNRGIEIAGAADVIFLNSDTKVTPGWFSNLRLAAYSEDRVATATPFSNNAGAFSAPEIGKQNPLPPAFVLDECARLVTRVSGRFYPKIPTGNGFCMYVRRDAIEEVGPLDAEAFPRGYGEENDFCMRAGRAGWDHVIDDATLIYHVRSASFGDEKTPLMKAGRAIIDQRYPEYTPSVRKFVEDPDIAAIRRRTSQAWNLPVEEYGIRPRVLFVVSTRTGGTPQTNADLMAALEDRYEPFLLRCDSKTIEFSSVSGRGTQLLETIKLKTQLKGFPHRSQEYDDAVAKLLVEHCIDLLHVRHIAWHGLDLTRIAKLLGLPVLFSFHDFYTVCPTIKLLDENLVFCGGRCTATQGECKHELWKEPDFPPLKNAAIREWQSTMARVLEDCDTFITTAASAREQISKIFPITRKRPFPVIPHGRDLDMVQVASPLDEPSGKVRILFPGNIDTPKGARIIEAIAKLDIAKRFEFHILGVSDIQANESIIVHGHYKREEFERKVENIRPHLGAIFSIWPETFCHTLTEMWACGLPVVAIDNGAVGERIRAHEGGWLLSEAEPAAVLAKLMAIADDQEGIAAQRSRVLVWQEEIGASHTTLHMSHGYDALYRRNLMPCITIPDSRPRVAVLVPDLGAASSRIRVIEKIRDTLDRPVRYDVATFTQVGNTGALADYDAVLVQRTAIPSEKVDSFLDRCASAGQKIIYEIDDDLTRFHRRKDDQVDYDGLRDGVVKLLVGADLVIVSTPELKHRFRHFNHNVMIAENALAERLWFTGLAEAHMVRGKPVKAVGEQHILYMGTRTHDADLALLEEAMASVRRHFPKTRLFTVGITAERRTWYEPITIPDPAKHYSRFVPWLRAVSKDMDLAVAPLVETDFNRAKSPLKHFEYAAAGLCGLYSNVEPYRSAVQDGETGFLVDNSAEDWTAAIMRAIEDPEVTRTIAERAYAEVALKRGMRREAERLDEAVLKMVRRAPAVPVTRSENVKLVAAR